MYYVAAELNLSLTEALSMAGYSRNEGALEGLEDIPFFVVTDEEIAKSEKEEEDRHGPD